MKLFKFIGKALVTPVVIVVMVILGGVFGLVFGPYYAVKELWK